MSKHRFEYEVDHFSHNYAEQAIKLIIIDRLLQKISVVNKDQSRQRTKDINDRS